MIFLRIEEPVYIVILCFVFDTCIEIYTSLFVFLEITFTENICYLTFAIVLQPN